MTSKRCILVDKIDIDKVKNGEVAICQRGGRLVGYLKVNGRWLEVLVNKVIEPEEVVNLKATFSAKTGKNVLMVGKADES